jgi:hypothetical protein
VGADATMRNFFRATGLFSSGKAPPRIATAIPVSHTFSRKRPDPTALEVYDCLYRRIPLNKIEERQHLSSIPRLVKAGITHRLG